MLVRNKPLQARDNCMEIEEE